MNNISPIKQEHDFYNAHKDEFVKKYLGKEVLVYQQKLQGVFDDPVDALRYAQDNNFEKDKFMIKTIKEVEPKIRVFGMWN